jgi:hypothetical protein
MAQHSLIGRYLVWDVPDREYWTLGRFKAKVSDFFFLVEQLQPTDGEPAIGGDFFVALGQLTIDDDDRASPRAMVFDSFEAVRRYFAEFEKPPGEKVVKLVKS